MNVILWLTQSCLLSVAIFFLLGEELVLNHKHGDVLCTKAIRVAGENTKQYSNNSHCCKLEKSSKWQIPFGVLATVQMNLLLVILGLRSHGKSPWPFLPVVCVTSWILNDFLLLTKLVVCLTPEPDAVENSSYTSAFFTFVWNSLTAVFAVGFQRIFHAVAHLTPNSDKQEGLLNGFYFCSHQSDKVLGEIGANIHLVVIVLIVAYFISSGYTLCLVLTHEDDELNEEPGLRTTRSTRQRRSKKRGDHKDDSSHMGWEGERQANKSTEGANASRNCLRDLNKNKLSVAFIEESDDESFVFGWRL
ncbi:uncharacterized protein LOC144639628 [Oculina patagonica]